MTKAGTIGRGFGFGLGLERRERVGPELVEELTQRTETLGLDGVDATRAIHAIGDEAGVFEHAQVLRDRRATDRKRLGQLADRERTLAELQQNRPPGRIAQGVELRVMVSVH